MKRPRPLGVVSFLRGVLTLLVVRGGDRRRRNERRAAGETIEAQCSRRASTAPNLLRRCRPSPGTGTATATAVRLPSALTQFRRTLRGAFRRSRRDSRWGRARSTRLRARSYAGTMIDAAPILGRCAVLDSRPRRSRLVRLPDWFSSYRRGLTARRRAIARALCHLTDPGSGRQPLGPGSRGSPGRGEQDRCRPPGHFVLEAFPRPASPLNSKERGARSVYLKRRRGNSSPSTPLPTPTRENPARRDWYRVIVSVPLDGSASCRSARS